jgi:hypothetical protein
MANRKRVGIAAPEEDRLPVSARDIGGRLPEQRRGRETEQQGSLAGANQKFAAIHGEVIIRGGFGLQALCREILARFPVALLIGG